MVTLLQLIMILFCNLDDLDKNLSDDNVNDFIAIIFTAKDAGKLSNFFAMILLKAKTFKCCFLCHYLPNESTEWRVHAVFHKVRLQQFLLLNDI